MRGIILATALCVTVAPVALTASASAPSVTFTYAADFETKLAKTYGAREKAGLERTVSRALARQLGGRAARVEVVIEDAVPNRPTLQQMSRTPGLSYQSFGIGGASASGKAFDAAGNQIGQASYDWYSNDIRWAWTQWTWGDADRALTRFATELAKASGA